jgi:pectinesterase inhibitor-like protein
MDFDRLGTSDPGGSSRRSTAPLTNSTTSNSSQKNKKLIMISILAASLIIASAISAALITVVRSRASSNDQSSPNHRAKPTQAISRTCSKTRFPTLCINSLLDFPGSTAANEQQLVHISFNMTHRHISKALFASSGLSYAVANSKVRAAYEDCLELMDESVDSIRMSMDSLTTMSSTLSRADELSTVAGSEDVMTWLSAALTNQDTCLEGFEDISGTVKDQMVDNLKDLSELVSNSLAIFSGSGDYDFTGVPIQNKRRLLGIEKGENDDDIVGDISREFPKWLKKRDRRLLSLPVSEIQADIIVSKSGNGTVKTITEAIKKAPDHGSRRFIIYVRAGR